MLRWIIACAIALSLQLCSYASAQTPTVVAVDINKANFTWNYLPGWTVEHVMQCGTSSRVYTLTSSVIEPIHIMAVNQIIKTPGEYYCSIFARNEFGRSADSEEIHFKTGNPPVTPTNLLLIVK